jgi:hypothetical protein
MESLLSAMGWIFCGTLKTKTVIVYRAHLCYNILLVLERIMKYHGR